MPPNDPPEQDENIRDIARSLRISPEAARSMMERQTAEPLDFETFGYLGDYPTRPENVDVAPWARTDERLIDFFSAKRQQQAPADPLSDFFKTKAAASLQTQAVSRNAAMMSAIATNPDQEAAIRKMASRMEMPVSLVRGMGMAEAQNKVARDNVNPANTPSLAKAYSQPDWAQLAIDDWEKLSDVERIIRQAGGWQNEIGNARRQINEFEHKLFLGQPLRPSEQLKYQDLENRIRVLSQQQKAGETGPSYVLNVISGTATDVASSLPEMAIYGAIGLIGGPQGARYGAQVGSAFYNYRQIVGTTFKEYRNIRDQTTGEFIDQDVARGGAFINAIFSVGLETFADKVLLGLVVPGAEKFLSTPGKDVVSQLLQSEGGRNVMMRVGKKVATGAIVEAVTEAIQEGSAILGGETVKAVAPGDFAPISEEETRQRIQTAAIEGGIGGGGLAGIAAGPQIIIENRAIARAERELATSKGSVDAVERAVQAASESKLIARDRGELEKFIDDAAADGPVSTVYFSADDLANVAREAGLEPQQLAQQLGVTDQIQPASVTNSLLEMPVGKFIATVADTDLAKPLIQVIKTNPFLLNRAEQEAYSSGGRQDIIAEADRLVQQALTDETFAAEAQSIQDEVLQQFRAFEGGEVFTPEVNRAYATITTQGYVSLARRMGISPREAYQKYQTGPLQIQRQAATEEGMGQPVLAQAKQVGYAGQNIGEAQEWVRAREKGLDMSQEGRLQRAREMGFDAGKIWYHGAVVWPTTKGPNQAALGDITAFDRMASTRTRKPSSDTLGVFLSDNPGEAGAGMYAGPGINMDQPLRPSPVVYPLVVRANNTYSTTFDEMLAKAAQLNNERGRPTSMEPYREWLKSQGFDSVSIAKEPGEFADQNVLVVLDEANIRSVNAAFDPEFAESANILAQSVKLRTGQETLKKQGLDPNKKYTTRQVAAALEARQRKKYGVIERGDYSDEASEKIQKWIVEEVMFEAELAAQSPEKSAVGWYSEKFQKALDAIGRAFPELLNGPAGSNLPGVQLMQSREDARTLLTALIAVTSDGAKVKDNLRYALASYAYFRDNGSLPTDFQFGGERNKSMRGNFQAITDLMSAGGISSLKTLLLQKDTVSNLKKLAKAEGISFSTAYKASMELPLAAINFGPKLGAFFANLMGDTGYLTMDRWWSRTFNRYRGTLLAQPTREGLERFKKLVAEDRQLDVAPEQMTDDEALALTVDYVKQYKAKGYKRGTEIEKAANTLYKAAFEKLEDQPFNASDREFMVQTTMGAQKRLKRRGINLTIADIQAVLWYYEKRLYGALGARQTADISYEEIASGYANDYADGRQNYQDVLSERPSDAAAGEPGDAGTLNPEDDSDPVDGEPNDTDVEEETLGQDEIDGRPEQARDGGRRYSSGGLAPLEGAPRVNGATGPDPGIVAVAEQYAAANGIDLRRQARYATVDPDFAARIAQAYEDMPHAPLDPAVQEAYANLKRQTRAQYDALISAGYTFDFFDSDTDPYQGNPSAAVRDLRANKRMSVYGTYDGYGTEGITGAAIEDNPMLEDTGLQWPDQKGVMHPVTANDLFRAVHDAFGHSLEGAGFRARGEENAWQAHIRLYTGTAIHAATSETRGQNSWLNYGPHGETNRTAGLGDTVFALQKTGLMPEWTWTEGVVEDAPETIGQEETLGQERELDAMGFYSALREAVDKSTTQKASAAQWKATLAKTPGVKAEEIEWTGVNNWLDLQTGPVTKQQLQEYLNANGVRIEETVLGGPSQLSAADQAYRLKIIEGNDQIKEVLRNLDNFIDSPRRRRESDKDFFDALFKRFFPDEEATLSEIILTNNALADYQNSPDFEDLNDALTKLEKSFLKFEDLSEAKDQAWYSLQNVQSNLKALQQSIEEEINSFAAVDGTKWSSWTLPGGENYREVLLKLPAKQITKLPNGFEVASYTTRDGETRWRVFSTESGIERGFGSTREEAIADAFQDLNSMPSARGDFRSSHWDDPNVLAHIRFKERTTADGRRLLAIEEIQSDWHQEGRKRGYESEKFKKDLDAARNRYRDAQDARKVAEEELKAAVKADPAAYDAAEDAVETSDYFAVSAYMIGEYQSKGKGLPEGELKESIKQARATYEKSAEDAQKAGEDLAKIINNPPVPDAPFKSDAWVSLVLKRAIRYAAEGGFDEIAWIPGKVQNGQIVEADDNRAAFYDKIVVNAANKLGKKYNASVGRIDMSEDVGKPDIVFHSLPITPEMREAVMAEGQPLFAPGRRAQYQPDLNRIMLLPKADWSSYLHEMGHHFLEVYNNAALQISQIPEADRTPDEQKLVDDMSLLLTDMARQAGTPITGDVLQWWANTPLDDRRPVHEKYAQATEKYFMEGKAPVPELQSLFDKFRDWLIETYKRLATALNVELSDEVRGVMDRMYAAHETVRTAEYNRKLVALFREKPEDMTEQEWTAYQQLAAQATDDAQSDLTARSLRDMQWLSGARARVMRELQRENADKRKVVAAEVTAEVMAQPVNVARSFLRRGIAPNGEPVVGPHKLSIDLLKARYPDVANVEWKRLGYGQYGMLAKDGMDPDMAAELLGYPSGDAMINDLLSAPPSDDVIKTETDRRMLERFGDLNDETKLSRAADEVIHSAMRAKVLQAEYAALSKAAKQTRPVALAAKEIAKEIVGRQVASKLNLNRYLAAERAAGRKAEAAMRSGDFRAAASAKRDQLLNFEVVREVQRVLKERNRALDLFDRINKAKRDTVAKTRNYDLVQAARAILAAYGFGSVKNKPMDYIAAVRAYDPALYAALEPTIIDAIATKQTIDQLTVSEFLGMRDVVRKFWDLSREEMKVDIEGRQLELEEITNELNQQLEAQGAQSAIQKNKPTEDATKWQKRLRQFAGLKGATRRVESWARLYDGGKVAAFTKYIWRPVSEAADRYRADRNKYIIQFRELFRGIENNMGGGKISAPEINHIFTNKSQLLHAILHTGNGSNYRKLLLGRGWGTEDRDGNLIDNAWQNLISRLANQGILTKADFDFVQSVWDLLEEIKPLAQKAHRKVFGSYFAEITAEEVQTPFGTYRGGYAPAIYDTYNVQDAALRAQQDAVEANDSTMFPSPASNFTKGRVEYNRELALDLMLFPQHIDKVLKFAHLASPVRDVLKILRNRNFSTLLHNVDATAQSDVLLPWLTRAARQIVEEPTKGEAGPMVDDFFRGLRQRSGMGLMFANLVNVAQQVTGFSLAALTVKPKYLASGLIRYTRNPAAITKAIRQASPMMADRGDNQLAAMYGTIEKIIDKDQKYEQARDWFGRHTYFMQQGVQNVMDVIVWLGAYDQALAQGATDQEAAKQGDAAVRQTQGSTLPEDVSRIESGKTWMRQFVHMYSYFNMWGNLLSTEVRATMRELGLKKGAGRLMFVYIAGFAVPALLAQVIADGMRGQLPEDEDDDGWLEEWLAYFFGTQAKTAIAFAPIVGQGITATIGAFTEVPYDDRIGGSPAISTLEAAARTPGNIYAAFIEGDDKSRAVKDTLTLMTLLTGIPFQALGRPLGYAVDVAEGDIEPTSELDYIRGLVTGTASEASRQ